MKKPCGKPDVVFEVFSLSPASLKTLTKGRTLTAVGPFSKSKTLLGANRYGKIQQKAEKT
jgi:hypothetical protein